MRKNMQKQKGFSLLVLILIILVALIIIGGGIWFWLREIASTQTPITVVDNGNESSLNKDYNKPCDLSKVSKIIASSNNSTKEYSVSGGKIFSDTGFDTTSIIQNIICPIGVGGKVSSYLSDGGNMDGKWFTIITGNKTTNLNMKEITENGEKVLVIQQRTATVLSDSAVYKAGNYVYVGQQKIYRDTRLLHQFVSFFIQGSDVMLDKSIEEIGSQPNPVDHYIPITYTYNQ